MLLAIDHDCSKRTFFYKINETLQTKITTYINAFKRYSCIRLFSHNLCRSITQNGSVKCLKLYKTNFSFETLHFPKSTRIIHEIIEMLYDMRYFTRYYDYTFYTTLCKSIELQWYVRTNTKVSHSLWFAFLLENYPILSFYQIIQILWTII